MIRIQIRNIMNILLYQHFVVLTILLLPSLLPCLSITFSMSIGLAALLFVIERKEGLLDRTWVAGVNATEMVLAQILTQCITLFVQSMILIILVKFAFKVAI